MQHAVTFAHAIWVAGACSIACCIPREPRPSSWRSDAWTALFVAAWPVAVLICLGIVAAVSLMTMRR